MENVIASLAEKVSPEALIVGTPTALKVGTISYSADLYKVFVADDDQQTTQVNLLKHLAMGVGLTCKEFAEQCKAAQEIATATDKANGFVPAADAKGSEKYGPKRALFNARVSEAKRIFGVFKIKPEVLAEKGYFSALKAARDWLAENNLEWDGEPIANADEKRQKREAKGLTKALADAMAANPQQPGEDRKEYLERVDAIACEQAFENEVASLIKSLTKSHDVNLVTLTAMARIIEAGATPRFLDDCVQMFGEAAMIYRLEELQG